MRNHFLFYCFIAVFTIITSFCIVDEERNGVIDNISVCHDNQAIIQVPLSEVQAHIAHGDAVDMDGDGLFNQANDCSIFIDDNDNDPTCCCVVIWYIDGDGDGYGDPNAFVSSLCGLEPCSCCSWVLNNDDCCDWDPEVPSNCPCPCPNTCPFPTDDDGNILDEDPINCDAFEEVPEQ